MPSVPDATGHRVFYLSPPWPDPGGDVLLSPEESRHAARVMRVRPSDALRVVDGEGREATAVAGALEGGRLRVRLTRIDRGTGEASRIGTLALPWIRSAARLEWALEKGTELGVSDFAIFGADRSVHRGLAAVEGKRERWRRITLAAMKQCGRASWPPVAVYPDLAALLAADASAPLWVADPAGETSVPPEAPPRRILLVGSEGGWSGPEEALLGARGALRLSLGPRRLRTETAAIALCVKVG